MGHHGSEDDALLVLLQQRLEARVRAKGVAGWDVRRVSSRRRSRPVGATPPDRRRPICLSSNLYSGRCDSEPH